MLVAIKLFSFCCRLFPTSYFLAAAYPTSIDFTFSIGFYYHKLYLWSDVLA